MYIKLNKMIQDIGVLNNDELNKVVEAVKLRRNQLHFQDAHSLRIGDRVSFTGRHGITENNWYYLMTIFRMIQNISTNSYEGRQKNFHF